MVQCNYNKTENTGSKLKKGLRVENHKSTDVRETMFRMKVLNIHKLNIFQLLKFKFKISDLKQTRRDIFHHGILVR